MKLLALRLPLTISLMAAAGVFAQQPPPPPQPTRDVQTSGRGQAPVPVGTAVISGMVTMAGTGQPARKVRVNLSGAELRGSRSTNTDDQGRFSFTALPAGRFTLSVNKPGHLSVTYGQRRPGTPGTAIQLSDGQKFQAQLQIPRGSVLTGVVLDENGEATPGTSVRAMRFVRQGERRTLQSAGSGNTDDRGMYRIFGLQPGDYVVCATPRNTQLSEFERGQVEIQSLRENLTALQGDRGNAEQVRAVQERLTAIQAATSLASDEAPSGYAAICYPGTLSTSEASPIALNVGEERLGIDFQLQLVPMARVEGMVLNSTGGQIQNLQVTLQEASALGNSFGITQSARPDNEGRFRINNVAPGQYKLTARAQIGGPQGRGQFVVIDGQPAPAGRGAPATPVTGRGASPAQRPEPVTVWGAADVVVDGRNVSNVMLPLQLGMSVSGQLTFEGAIPPPTDLTRLRVTINSADPGPVSTNSSARVDASGRFTVQSVAPGRYRLTASGAQGWFLESVTVGGQDALDFPFEVKPNQAVGSVTLTFTDKQTELTGTVVDDKNQPAVDYTLVIFPADNRYWTGTTSRRIQTVRPGTDGRYTLRNLPPGDYKIATVLDMEPGSAADPAFLQQVEAATLRVTLQPGEKKQQDIRLSSR